MTPKIAKVKPTIPKILPKSPAKITSLHQADPVKVDTKPVIKSAIKPIAKKDSNKPVVKIQPKVDAHKVTSTKQIKILPK